MEKGIWRTNGEVCGGPWLELAGFAKAGSGAARVYGDVEDPGQENPFPDAAPKVVVRFFFGSRAVGRRQGDQGDPCPVQQQQIAPLEAVFEKLGDKVDHFVVLGNFNRNLWHGVNEVAGAKAVRSDGTGDLSKPRAASVKAQNLFKEINDGMPTSSKASLVTMNYPRNEEAQKLCEHSKTESLKRGDLAPLTGRV
jgi:hypothetical protein